MNISERIVFVMSIKYAQRRSVESIANQIELSRDVVLDRLLELQSRKLVRRWTDGGWGLTGTDNMARNRLTTINNSPL
jgi:DNA-binding transcriptional regulator LsrR (DeoR family)